MTSEEIAQVVENGETMYAEFKSVAARPESLATAFISFLNTEGGVLWLGIEDYGTVKGVADVDAARQRVDQILANNVTPRATAFVEQVEVGEKLLLKIAVPRGVDRPYYTQRGQCYVRQNAGKRLASREEIRRMYMAVRAFYYDETALTGTGLTEVELPVFDAFLTAAYGLTEETDRPEEELARLLRNLKCMAGDELTVAGALLFGHQPQRMLPTARVEFAHFAGTAAGETILDRKTIDGRLPQQLEQVESLLRLHLRNAGVIRGFEPEVQTELPLEMLREALTNALVHRDYSLSAPVRVFLFEDRLEIRSPGPLPNSVTLENVRAGIHVERNPIILSLMSKLGLMTRLGTGIVRIYRLAAERGLPEPELEESGSEFVVILYRMPAPGRKRERI
jgi:ATP-dependent DNA helicase RecG